jgi:glycerol uptake facilitator-like aquaporin
VTVCILAFGPITGGSVNPARTFGPALATGDFSEVGIYVSAQLIGASCAGLLYRFVWNRANVKHSASNTIAIAAAS